MFIIHQLIILPVCCVSFNKKCSTKKLLKLKQKHKLKIPAGQLDCVQQNVHVILERRSINGRRKQRNAGRCWVSGQNWFDHRDGATCAWAAVSVSSGRCPLTCAAALRFSPSCGSAGGPCQRLRVNVFTQWSQMALASLPPSLSYHSLHPV